MKDGERQQAQAREKIAAARKAVDALRDAVRQGVQIDFRQRDPLVLAIHAVIDGYEQAKTDALREAYEAGWHDSHDHYEPGIGPSFPPNSVEEGFRQFVREFESRGK